MLFQKPEAHSTTRPSATFVKPRPTLTHPRTAGAAWRREDGGLLRCWPEAAADEIARPSGAPVEVLPVPGRLVLFDAQAMLHEVTECRRDDRVALSTWILGPG